MLTIARRPSVNSSYYSDSAVDKAPSAPRPEPPEPEHVKQPFVEALERVISGEARYAQPPDTGGDDQARRPPDLDALAGLVIDALDSRQIRLTLTGSDAAFVRDMPCDHWEVVKSLFEATPGTGPITATLGPELTKGSDTLAAGLQLLGVSAVDAHAPIDTAEMRLNVVCAPNSGQRPWQPKITVIRSPAGSALQHVYVNDGAEVTGRGFSGLGVTVHYTDDQGGVLRSSPLEQARVEPAWKQTLFLALSSSLRGAVLDLSGWTGLRAEEARKLQQADWAQWQAIAGVDLNLVLVSPDLRSSTPLIEGVAQVCTSDIEEDADALQIEAAAPLSREEYELADSDSRAAFLEAMRSGTPAFNAQLFDALLDKIPEDAPTVLDLSIGVPHEVALVLREVTRDAWKALLLHPDAAALKIVLMSMAMDSGGPLPIGLAQVRGYPST
jgi:hypothetical protein